MNLQSRFRQYKAKSPFRAYFLVMLVCMTVLAYPVSYLFGLIPLWEHIPAGSRQWFVQQAITVPLTSLIVAVWLTRIQKEMAREKK